MAAAGSRAHASQLLATASLDSDEPRDAEALRARLERRWYDAYRALALLYGQRDDLDAVLTRCLETVAAIASQRPESLRRLDHRREIAPDWHLQADRVGYVCYVDRFAGTLSGVADAVDYLAELGVTYLHLMPLLQPRPGENDGGYAVADYRSVDRRLGTMSDLEALATAVRARGISLCIDLVVNHTAREHEWARKAAAGDERYRAYYRIYDDRTVPDRYEATLPEVFPATAPGNFTWSDDVGGWVWTTFHDYQWDLDYTNPDVFLEMLEVMGFLANRGVEVLRLDAVPFLWKREGTDSQNQPEAHLLLQAFRALIAAAAPAVLFKAEAIVAPDELVRYLGTRPGRRAVGECELAYHNQLMVMGWSAAATRDARLAVQSLSRMPTPPPGTTWVTYVRGHDDIGWAVTDVDAAAVGWDGAAHRRFLADFFAGEHPGTFARGARFQDGPPSGARTSGTTASLCGLQEAIERDDALLIEAAIRRLLLLYGVAASFGGIPAVYMGDELGQRNDATWDRVPEQQRDNRWLHRPHFDAAAAQRRHDPASLEHRIYAGLRHLLDIRKHTPQLRSDASTTVLASGDPSIFAFERFHPREGALLVLANFADTDRVVRGVLGESFDDSGGVDVLSGEAVLPGAVAVPGLGLRWIAEHA